MTPTHLIGGRVAAKLRGLFGGGYCVTVLGVQWGASPSVSGLSVIQRLDRLLIVREIALYGHGGVYTVGPTRFWGNLDARFPVILILYQVRD